MIYTTKGNKHWSRVGVKHRLRLFVKLYFYLANWPLVWPMPSLQKIHVLAIDPVIFNFSFMHQVQTLIKLFLFSGS